MTTRKVIALLVVALFVATGLTVLATGTGETHSSAFPQATADATLIENSIQPNPIMYGNITWSSFQSNWTNPLTYQSGATTNNTSVLPASLSPLYNNSIAVNPTDIQSKLLSPGNTNFSNWYIIGNSGKPIAGILGNTITSGTMKTTLSKTKIVTTINETPSSYAVIGIGYRTMYSQLPSTNFAFDYVTIAYSIQSTVPTGVSTEAIASENSSASTVAMDTTNANGVGYITFSMAQAMSKSNNGFNATNALAHQITTGLMLNIPKGNNNTIITLTITGFALSNTPYTLGTYLHNNTVSTVYNASGTSNVRLHSLAPDFAWTDIGNAGYSVAVAQDMAQSQNPTISQTAISQGSYVEQVTYQTQGYKLPPASDLIYGTFAMIQPMNGIPGNQYIVADLNGNSYLPQIQALNGTTAMVYGAVPSPNTNNTMVLTVDYTQAQWNGISSPPVWYSVAGVEYYWYVFLGVLLGVIGLGAGMKSRASTFRQVKK